MLDRCRNFFGHHLGKYIGVEGVGVDEYGNGIEWLVKEGHWYVCIVLLFRVNDCMVWYMVYIWYIKD